MEKKIFISADIEGVSGITSWAATEYGGKGYEKKRRSPGKAAGGYQKRQPGERVHLLRRGDVSAGPVSGGAEGPAGAGGL